MPHSAPISITSDTDMSSDNGSEVGDSPAPPSSSPSLGTFHYVTPEPVEHVEPPFPTREQVEAGTGLPGRAIVPYSDWVSEDYEPEFLAELEEDFNNYRALVRASLMRLRDDIALLTVENASAVLHHPELAVETCGVIQEGVATALGRHQAEEARLELIWRRRNYARCRGLDDEPQYFEATFF